MTIGAPSALLGPYAQTCVPWSELTNMHRVTAALADAGLATAPGLWCPASSAPVKVKGGLL